MGGAVNGHEETVQHKSPTLRARLAGAAAVTSPVTEPDCGWALAGRRTDPQFDRHLHTLMAPPSGADARGQAEKEATSRVRAPGYDDVTGKTAGWGPAEASGLAKFWLRPSKAHVRAGHHRADRPEDHKPRGLVPDCSSGTASWRWRTPS